MFKPRKIECVLPGKGSGTRFNIGKGSPRHAEYKNDVSKRIVHALIESGDHDHISKTVAQYCTSKNGPLTLLIQNGKAGDETASNSSIGISDTNESGETAQQSSIDVYKNLEDKIGNKLTRNSNIAVNRIYEE